MNMHAGRKAVFICQSEERLLEWLDDEELSPEDLTVRRTEVRGGQARHHLTGGVVVVEHPTGWSVYLAPARAQAEGRVEAWTRFARAGWTSTPPTEPGVYPCLDRNGVRVADRRFRRRLGGVVDASEYVRPGRVTEFVGYFWRLPYPGLPGLPEGA